MSNELRQNKITKEWVIVAPSRGRRPHDKRPAPLVTPASAASCPFCPGNEHMLPYVIAQWPPQTQGAWQTRVVPNKYPALAPENASGRMSDGF